MNYVSLKAIVATDNKVILTEAESLITRNPLCCVCKEPITGGDLVKAFGEKVLEHYKKLKEFRELRDYEEEVIVEVNSKDISKLKKEISYAENTKCSICKEPVIKSESYMLDCSHEYHIRCLENYIEAVSLGKIYLTKEERDEHPIACIVCQIDITDKNIEHIFSSFPNAINNYKKIRDLKEEEDKEEKKSQTESMDRDYTLSCCEKTVLIGIINKKLEGSKLFRKEKDKVVGCLCPYCEKNMSINDIMTVFADEVDVILTAICANCLEPLKSNKTKANCNLHSFCNNCLKRKQCKICDIILDDKKPNRKRKRPEEQCGITCEKCNKNSNPIKGSLLYCYHFLCNDCISTKNSKQYCPTCEELRKRIKVV